MGRCITGLFPRLRRQNNGKKLKSLLKKEGNSEDGRKLMAKVPYFLSSSRLLTVRWSSQTAFPGPGSPILPHKGSSFESRASGRW